MAKVPTFRLVCCLCHPHAGLVQGAEAYLRSLVSRVNTGKGAGARLVAVLAEWDAHTGRSQQAAS
jgi:hypothetical protein